MEMLYYIVMTMNVSARDRQPWGREDLRAALNVRGFGAEGDGVSDDSAAFQAALDAAGESGGAIYVPAGVYRVKNLRLWPGVGLIGDRGWTFRRSGGSVLQLADGDARCLIDMTGALGATLTGLSLEGNRLGQQVHGVMIDKPDYGVTEDTIALDNCRIDGFSGNGVHLERIWCFSIRHCMISHNQGDGVSLRGWDGFILDNWLSGNGRAGLAAREENASCTFTGNRIEWNQEAGILLLGGAQHQLTGNYFDRTGGPGIRIGRNHRISSCISVVGNVIYRSGKPEHLPAGEYASCQAFLEDCQGLVFQGNSMQVGLDKGDIVDGVGRLSPEYGIVCRRLTSSIIKDNVLHEGALRELVVDLGGHGPGVQIRDNVGSLFARS